MLIIRPPYMLKLCSFTNERFILGTVSKDFLKKIFMIHTILFKLEFVFLSC
jgi:hypothetical protein